MDAAIRVEKADVVPAVDLVSLYTAVGWKAYEGEPDLLVSAVDNSDFVATAVATDAEGQEKLVGLIRVLTDSVSVVFIQDLLVHPQHARQGIGTELIKTVVTRYDGVQRFVLVTDPEPAAVDFFSATGFTSGTDSDITTFVRS